MRLREAMGQFRRGRLFVARLGYRVTFFTTALAVAVVFGVSLWQLGNFLINEMNTNRLASLAETAITRMERNIDFAVIGMGDLAGENHFACRPLDRKALQQVAYSSGSVRDIRLQSADGTCWGMEDSEATFGQAVDSARPSTARNQNYQLATIKVQSWRGLMVKWNGDGWNILSVIGTSGLLFDLLPAELRDHGSMSMSLTDGMTFADYQPEGGLFADSASSQRFTAQSTRYPIAFSLDLDEAALARWNHGYHLSIEIAAGLFSLAFGLLAARGIVRPPSPLDDLDRALAQGEIVPFYQPLFSLEDNRVIGFEMLARWVRADGTMTPPAEFIPLAEREGRINALTIALLTRAGEDVGPLLKGDPLLKLTFNVTPEQFLSENFVETLLARVARCGLPPENLVIEITERQAIGDVNRANDVSRRLVEHGFRIAIDDAGTGHNGLSSLHALNANYMKIDKYFVDGVTLNRKSSVLIEMMVSLADQLGMTVVAEGIESRAQIETLKELGIREGQGYVFSRPVAANALRELLASQTPVRPKASPPSEVRETPKLTA